MKLEEINKDSRIITLPPTATKEELIRLGAREEGSEVIKYKDNVWGVEVGWEKRGKSYEFIIIGHKKDVGYNCSFTEH
tara:strand:+ start:2252 stop:2485 length:234 start_codon:yes stop_codon:yes gene_type:complete